MKTYPYLIFFILLFTPTLSHAQWPCGLQYQEITENFNFQTMDPAEYDNSIWVIRYCHDLQNQNLTIPENVILLFEGGQLTNFNTLEGNLTGIEASSTQIFNGQCLDGTWLVESINACWFGAKPGDPNYDNIPALEKALEFLNKQDIRKMVIPPGSYHLSEFWNITYGGTSPWYPVQIEGYGAIFDNTVVASMKSISLKGLTVDDSPGHGFVFLRGQGAHHEHLLAINCAGDGFYCGIDGLNGEEYGANFQVTRSVFSGLIARDNLGNGWMINGDTEVNNSWFNANAVISFGAVNNMKKGFVNIQGSNPNGESKMNYNTFVNMNCEQNEDIAVDMPDSRANTFIGGHFVDKDPEGYVFRIPGPNNVNFGGRYVGNVEHSNFIYANINETGQGGIIGNIRGVDKFETKDLAVLNEPYLPLGWSILPRDLEKSQIVTGSTSGHIFGFDFSDMPNSDDLMIRLTRFGNRNFSGGANQMFAYTLLIHLTRENNGDIHLDWSRLSDDLNCEVVNVSVDNNDAAVSIQFNTDNPIFGNGFGVTEYQDSKNTDFR